MGGAVVERRPPSSSHIQHKSANPKAKGNGWGAKGGDSMVVDSVGRAGGGGGGGGRKGGEEKGRIGMGAATQTGASSWGAGGGQQGGQGAPQRRVLFHPAHNNKGSLASSQQQQHQHSAALLRPLNAPMAGCSNNNNGGNTNSRAGPSGSSSLQHEPLNGAPVSRIGAGLSNLGNTCFLNSVLQCLTYTPPLAGYLESGQHKATCRVAGFCAMCALQEHVRQALASLGGVVSPSNLVKNLRCISKSFRMWRQEDAHEYMRYLIEALHNSCLPPGAAANSTAAQDRSLIHKIFGGRLRSQVKCTLCSTCSNTYDPLLDLSLEIVRADSLTKALNRFTAVEALEGDNKYHCGNCRKKVRALKQFTIDKSPNILTVQFKRFSGTGSSGGKIDKKIEFGRTLDMKPYISNPQDSDAKYSLYAVLVHAGWSTHSGHYYCFVRTGGDMWHALDDSRVKQVSEKTVLDQKAYILFYIRDSASQSSSGREQSLPNSLRACKQLLSDGAGEAADDVDTSADDLESNGCQGSREGAACGAHVYSNGHGRNAAERGGITAPTVCCPSVRPAGNSQVSPTGDTTVDSSNGSGNLTGQTDGPTETSKIPVGEVVASNPVKVVPSGTKSGPSTSKTTKGDGASEVSGTKVGSEPSVRDNPVCATESLVTPDLSKSGPALLSSVIVGESLKVPDKITVKGGDVVGSKNLENGGELVKEGGKVENGVVNCSTSGDEECVDWEDDAHKKFNSNAPHSYMRLLYAMPHTRRYFMARSLPIQRDRKRVAGKRHQGQVEDGLSNGSSSCGKRACCVVEGCGTNKKHKSVAYQDTAQASNGGIASNGHSSGFEPTNVFRERMQVDEACLAGGSSSSAKDENGHDREDGQQSNGTVDSMKNVKNDVKSGCGSDLQHQERNGLAASQISHQDSEKRANGKSSIHLQLDGLYGFEVPRWGEAETNGNEELKDIDSLLRSDKTLVPKLDSWDEEYDRGKVKKVRNSDKHTSFSDGTGLANPFQAILASKQRAIDDIRSRATRQAGVKSHSADERGG